MGGIGVGGTAVVGIGTAVVGAAVVGTMIVGVSDGGGLGVNVNVGTGVLVGIGVGVRLGVLVGILVGVRVGGMRVGSGRGRRVRVAGVKLGKMSRTEGVLELVAVSVAVWLGVGVMDAVRVGVTRTA